MKKKVTLLLAGMILITIFSGCMTTGSSTKDVKADEASTKTFEGKKILYIDSYNTGYEWSDGETKGIENILNNTGIELKIFRMDTKRNDSEDFGKQEGIKAKSVIEDFQPDVVITCDDPAFKYVIMPYYRDAALPVVFCGINWDVSIYGAPYENTAGMIEVSLTPQLISYLKEYSKGDRIGFIAGNTTTDRKNAEYYTKLYNINFTRKYHVTTFEEWKRDFLKLQEEVDIVILENNAGITDWDNNEAQAFVLENTKIPAGATLDWMPPYSLIGMTKIAEEQGEWSAMAALRILNGTRPSDIPIVTNKKGRLYLNLKIAEKLGVIINPEILKNAEIIH
ncbi:MAG: ABC transporter substrate-binding protein [Candidatus Methanoperedens sp.]|nr:ABC transporter substrate-binding protein [Candidatus Methanoperedens sp.]